MVYKIDVDEMMKEAREHLAKNAKHLPPELRHSDLMIEMQLALLKWLLSELNSAPPEQDVLVPLSIGGSSMLFPLVAVISTISNGDPRVKGLAGNLFMSALHAGLKAYMQDEKLVGTKSKVPTKDLGDA